MSDNENLNQYTQLLYYIKEQGEADTYINSITKNIDELELDKITIYPLLNIDISRASLPSEGTISFSVDLSCWAIRDINPEVNTDKFWRQDNEVDNLNGTLASLNRLWKILKRDLNNNNITASEAPTLESLRFSKNNLLDGWNMSFDVEMPNVAISLCDGCE